ncbi:MAG: hypothetical protein Fues2KO_29360 [Fuerstiella sp.]
MQPPALYYEPSGYVESTSVSASKGPGPAGLMGRQVAGREFLNAYLQHGSWSELVALTAGVSAKEELSRFCIDHPSSAQRQRRLKTIAAADFHSQFLVDPPASVLHFPNPADPSYAWARQRRPHALAFSGVTHTLCSQRAVEVLRGLVTDPWEPYDRLICTSRAVQRMVTTIVSNFSDYLKDRFGGDPKPRIQLETIPLGVDTQRFHPATSEERRIARQRFRIQSDEIAVLFVGRLSHHAKAHPFPMFHACQQAARRSGKSLRLLMCGWAPSEAVASAFCQAGAAIAPEVKIEFPDGMDRRIRSEVWHAADVFISLVDNIQETFGLVLVEAMASGLPVIATDWNGYRDLVVEGQTGSLIPTHIVPDAIPELTSQLLTGAINYDHFLARASQTVTVDLHSAADALTRLCEDSSLRRQYAAAGRKRAEECFDWRHVIARYESMWQQQEQQLAEVRACSKGGPSFEAPAAYPPLETSFSGYPTSWFDRQQRLRVADGAEEQLDRLLELPLMTHEATMRCSDAAVMKKLLQHSDESKTLATWERQFQAAMPEPKCRPTIAWLIKYGLLIPVDAID